MNEQKIEWDGVGLPPVHANIEWIGKRGGYWVKARVIDYTSTQVCLLHHSDQKYKPHEMEVFNISNINFRRIKSERLIAIERLDAIIESLRFQLTPDDMPTKLSEKLYDSGLRFTEEK